MAGGSATLAALIEVARKVTITAAEKREQAIA